MREKLISRENTSTKLSASIAAAPCALDEISRAMETASSMPGKTRLVRAKSENISLVKKNPNKTAKAYARIARSLEALLNPENLEWAGSENRVAP